MKKILLFIFIFFNKIAGANGFTANYVDIKHLENGLYRIYIKYTNLKINQYEEAVVDFTSKQEALETFQKLAKGATFYWGDSKKINFPKDAEKLNPY
jgi:hypothetical protein